MAKNSRTRRGVTQTFWQWVPRQRISDSKRQTTICGLLMWRHSQLMTGSRTKMLVVVMRSQRLVTSVPPDTVEQCRPGIGASSYTVCTWCAQARQANEGRRVVAASDHGRTSSCHWPLGLPHLTLVAVYQRQTSEPRRRQHYSNLSGTSQNRAQALWQTL